MSLRHIEVSLGVSRSTLSGWLKGVELTDKQVLILKDKWRQGLVKARKKAILYHQAQKRGRLEIARQRADFTIKSLDMLNRDVLKLALAMLFAGEGFKKAEETSLGNSDPVIVLGYLRMLELAYGLDKRRLRLYLHLRNDQAINDELKFWSTVLNIGTEYFKIAPVDKRTFGRPTFEGYHGVCVVRYYDVSVKRELLEIARVYFSKLNYQEL